MTERGFLTEFWDDKWVEGLEINQRYLFLYLWTNQHCNQAGLYEITIRKISGETKLPEVDIPQLLKSLSPKVLWYQELDLVWVKNFVRRQAKSPKFLIAVAKSLKTVLHDSHSEIIKDILDYNERYSVSIPYQISYPYSTDTHARSSADADSSAKADSSAISVGGKGSNGPEEKPIGGVKSGAVPRPAEDAALSATTRARSAEDAVPAGAVPPHAVATGADQTDLVTLYEKTFGIVAYPTLVDELSSFATEYPREWINDAFSRARSNRARNPMRYMETILSDWKLNGREAQSSPGREAKGSRASRLFATAGMTDEQVTQADKELERKYG